MCAAVVVLVVKDASAVTFDNGPVMAPLWILGAAMARLAIEEKTAGAATQAR